MANAQFYISRTEPFGPLPEQWVEHWSLVLSRPATATYHALRDENLASAVVDVKRIARYLGLSQTGFAKAVRELEEHGFLWLDTDDNPPSITLNDVPVVPDDAPVPAPKTHPQTPWHTVWEFINHWVAAHERHTDESYPRPQRGKRNRDTTLIDEMLRTYSLQTLKEVATWFLQNRRAEEPSTIAYFEYHLPRLVSDWQNKGGVPLPKMRE